MRVFVSILFSLLFYNLQAQEIESGLKPQEGWDLGLNFGFYMPSSYHANFYNGSEANDNKLSFILGNKYLYNDIANALDVTDTFMVSGMPTNMSYTSAFNIGVYFKRSFGNKMAFAAFFNFAKLHAADFFQVEVDPNVIATEADLRIFPIWGTEDRVNIDLSFFRYFKTCDCNYMPFFEGGININSTRVKENKINIGGQDYSLVNVYLNGSYIPGAQQNTYNIQQGGIGWGIHAGGGVKLAFNEKITIDPGIKIYWQKINLEQYQAFKPGLEIYVRLSLGSLISSNE